MNRKDPDSIRVFGVLDNWNALKATCPVTRRNIKGAPFGVGF